MKSKCTDTRAFYDLQILQELNRPIDKLYEHIRYHNQNLINYYKRNEAYKQFNNITLQLVLDFKIAAKSHIETICKNVLNYGQLYHFAQIRNFFMLDIEYVTFPLLDQDEKKKILSEIEKMASQFYEENSLLYNITCLELLYFYALLVNPSYNWIVIDYLASGNKNHQYAISADTYTKSCSRY